MTTLDPAVAPSPPATPPKPKSPLWALARRVHFMAGLAIAPFLAVLAATGLLYAFTPQLNDLLYSDKLYVAEPGGPVRPLADQVSAALAGHPDGKVKSVIVPTDPDRTTQVVLDAPGLAHGADHFSTETLTVYVDPYTAKVNGELVTVNNRPPAQVWLRELHGSLHLGDVGRLYSEFVASWLPFVVLGGLVLWIGRRRKRSARALLLPAATGSPRARTRSRHGALGLWLSLALLGLSATGLTWSNYAGANFDTAIAALNAKSPSLTAPAVEQQGEAIGLDKALSVAREQGMQGQLTITPGASATKPLKIAETAEGLPVRKTTIAVDPYTAEVTARQGWDDFPLLAKLTTLGVQAHSGTLFGFANQLLLGLVALGALVLLVLGYRMWWRRRPTTGGFAPAPEPVWRLVPVPVLVVAVLILGAVGWALPVLGVTLAAFVLVDGVRR
ncbi:PepSY-associated TM helix domain-containing protein [Actinokineospora sp. HUAS TT18]|uniref:PepSY-associated TM helix domain-containing protein n=1 Tax=Actinokineospora sp. HUAS TT18 TaxID=3447451 RepID=UPI003F520529